MFPQVEPDFTLKLLGCFGVIGSLFAIGMYIKFRQERQIRIIMAQKLWMFQNIFHTNKRSLVYAVILEQDYNQIGKSLELVDVRIACFAGSLDPTCKMHSDVACKSKVHRIAFQLADQIKDQLDDEDNNDSQFSKT